VGAAKGQIAFDGFTVGAMFPVNPADAWFVADQNPSTGTMSPPGSAISFTAVELKPGTCP
jgi:hypothetical protein